MVNKIIFLTVFSFVLFSSLVSAELSSTLEVESTFSQGENLHFNYSFLSTEDASIEFVPSILCPGVASPLLQITKINLSSFLLYKGIFNYESPSITEGPIHKQCQARIMVISPERYEQTIIKNFTLVSDPLFDFSLEIQKKTFLIGENILLSYKSSLENPSISASLKFPNGTSQNIQLPHQFVANRRGTYQLQVIATKEGYMPKTQNLIFAVIESEANIPLISADVQKENNSLEKFVIIPIISLLVIFLLVVILYIILRKRNIKNQESNLVDK